MPRTALPALAALLAWLPAGAQEPGGTVRGTVRDADSGQPLPQASVVLIPSSPQLGAATDSLGRFAIGQVPVGFYTIQASAVGFAAQAVAETWVRSGKETVVDLLLRPAPVALQAVEVGAVDRWWEARALDARPFTVEQGLRYPAMFSDPARVVTTTPGVVSVNDQANHLTVRGNSPNATIWLLEGAEIVSPNHLGNAGTPSDLPTLSGGGVNVLSAQMLGPSRLRTGVMPAGYGDAVGGIMDIALREGSRSRREWTVQAGLMGIDLSTEGPIGRKGEAFHLVNARYSTLGLLSAMGVQVGDEAVSFQDLAVHAGVRLGGQGELRVFGMGGSSSSIFHARSDPAEWKVDQDSRDITYLGRVGAGGATARIPIGERAALRATAAWSEGYQERTETEHDTAAMWWPPRFRDLRERKLSLVARAEGAWGRRVRYAAGASAMERTTDNLYGQAAAGWLLRPFGELTVMLSGRSQLTAGLAWSRYTYAGGGLPEPRIGLMVRAGHGVFMAAVGVRGQLPPHAVMNLSELPPAFLALGIPDNRAIGLQRSEDATVGYEHRLREGLVARVEAYAQRLPDAPTPWTGLYGGSAVNALLNAWDDARWERFEGRGEGRNIGAELGLSRDFSRGWYAQANGSAFRSTCLVDGMERPTRWDAGWTANGMAGKEWRKAVRDDLVRTWGASVRLMGAGGLRYTPVMAELRRGFWFLYPGEPYAAKLRDAHRLDLRLYLKRDRAGRTGMWALDVQNATAARNEASRLFDRRSGAFLMRYQMGLIPNLSYRIEF